MPNGAVGVPKEKPPPAAVLFAGVPKLKELGGLGVAWVVAVPNVKLPPVASGMALVIAKPVLGAAAVGFCAAKEKPVEA